MKEITDQVAFLNQSGFWNSPIGKKWLEEDRKAVEKIVKENKPRAKAMLLDMSKMKLDRFK